MSQSVAEAFAQAVAAKDHDRIRELMGPDLDWRAMTPRKIWEASDAEGVIDAVKVWFGDTDDIERLEAVETDSFADRERVGYRLRINNPDGEHLVEQQAYLTLQDGKIAWMRIMCSGYRPVS
ncbi:MAG TPA: hypothetical protein VHE56_07810 [Mycobacteriales bacterium]|nr:hypothetical protein [Mycobacteriales bacterium]